MEKRNTDNRHLLSSVRCFVLDLDGTLYLGERWIDGALDFVQRARGTGRRVVVLTNNTSRGRAEYLEKLRARGLALTEGDVITASQATLAYLRRNHPGQKVFLLGNATLRREFERAGVALAREEPDLVVTAFDTSLTYDTLCLACRFVRDGLPYVATHPDLNCPTEDGPVPDIGAIHAFIEASAGRRPDVVVGKPNAGIVEYLEAETGIPAHECAMVGDRLYTDIALGVNHGLLPVLVLSGETIANDLAESTIQPELWFDSVKEMIPWL